MLQSLLQIGVSRNTNLVYEPNWLFIIGMVLGFLLLILIIVLLIIYLNKKSWRITKKVVIKYREKNMRHDFQSSRSDNTFFQFMHEGLEHRLKKKRKKEERQEVRYGQIEDIRRQLQSHLAEVRRKLLTEDDRNPRSILQELIKLQNIVADNRNFIDGSEGALKRRRP